MYFVDNTVISNKTAVVSLKYVDHFVLDSKAPQCRMSWVEGRFLWHVVNHHLTVLNRDYQRMVLPQDCW